MAPESASGPSNHSRISCTSAKGKAAGMAAGAGGDRDQSVRALFDRFMGEAVVDDVVHQAAVGMDGGVDVLARASEVMTIGAFHFTAAQVLLDPAFDRWTIWLTAKGAAGAFGMGAIMGGQRFGDFVQPFVELAGSAAR